MTDSPLPPALPPSDADRRRSGRVYVVMPVTVTWTNRAGMRLREHGETQVISRHGALLRVLLSLKASVPLNTEVQLSRPASSEAARARVVWAGDLRPDGTVLVGVELTAPTETFWGVKLPAE